MGKHCDTVLYHSADDPEGDIWERFLDDCDKVFGDSMVLVVDRKGGKVYDIVGPCLPCSLETTTPIRNAFWNSICVSDTSDFKVIDRDGHFIVEADYYWGGGKHSEEVLMLTRRGADLWHNFKGNDQEAEEMAGAVVFTYNAYHRLPRFAERMREEMMQTA